MIYRTIVADPPWPHPGTGGKLAGWRGDWQVARERPVAYPEMSVRQIEELPIADLADRDARLFLWSTNTRMPDAFRVLEQWTFSYRQTLVWSKPDANPVGGSVAPNAEFVLVGVRGAPPVLDRLSAPVIQHPRGGLIHSQKPELFLDEIERVSPGPYLELFARRQRLGWDTWGDQALGHVEMAS